MEQIQLEATNEQTPPARLRQLAQINTAIASLVAANPNATPELLRELADSEEDLIGKNVAANPNTPTLVLWKLGEKYPEEVLENVVFPLLLLENPNLLEEIPYKTMVSFVRCSAVPVSFMEWAATTTRWKGVELLLSLGTNSETPRSVLEKLVGSKHKLIAEVGELHVNYAGELEEDWQEEFSRHLNGSPAILGTRSFSTNTAERYFLGILTAMGLIPEFLFFFESLAGCDRTDIRELVASIAIPLNLLKKLGRDRNPIVRAAAARNPNAPAELLERFAKDKDWSARAGAAENPNASSQLLERLARDELKQVREKVAENPNAPAYLLKELADDEGVFLAVASNRNTPKSLLEKARSKLERNRGLKKILAANPNTPVDILEKLERDKERIVRDRLAGNPSTPKHLLERLASSNRDETRQALASNPKIPRDAIHLLARDQNSGVRRVLAANPKTPLAVLLSLSRDEYTEVRIAVATNPKAPFSLLEKSLADLLKFRKMELKTLLRYLREKPEGLPPLLELIAAEPIKLTRVMALWHPQMPPKVLAENGRSLNWLERCAIAQNPNTPIETLQLLAADGNRIVRAAAKEGACSNRVDSILKSNQRDYYEL